MADEMSRREWWSIVGGLLAAFGLVHKAPAQPPPKLPVPPPKPAAPPNYFGRTYSYSCGDVTTFTYDSCGRLLSTCDPPHPRTVTTYTYNSMDDTHLA